MRTDALRGRKLTYRDFLKFPDDGKRHELIDGVHYVTPCPATPHQRILGNLYFLLRSHLEQHGGGEAFLSPFDVIFSIYDIVEPDLLFISKERHHIVTDKNVQGSPDLLVEILSPSTRRRDEGMKLRLYDASDVREYWVIDPSAEVVRVYRRVDGQLAITKELARDDGTVLTSPVLPGLKMPLERMFAR
jgi:Uma2 family endonuclease